MTKLTAAQFKALDRYENSRPIPGLITFEDSGMGVGLRRSAWQKMMGVLEQQGLVEPYVHGGYEITGVGKAAVQEHRRKMAAV